MGESGGTVVQKAQASIGQKRPVYANNALVNPTVPFALPLKNKLQAGDLIIIEGYTPPKSSGFAIRVNNDQQRGQLDQLFHLNIKFEKNGGCKVMRNSCLKARWGQEETLGGQGNLRQGQPLKCYILINPNCYKVSFNGKHYCNFNHRAPFTAANQLAVDGSVVVDSVSFQPPYVPAVKSPGVQLSMPALQQEGSNKVGNTTKASQINNTSPNFPVKYGWTLPMYEYIEGGMVPGRMIYISAKPYKQTVGFTVNFRTQMGASRQKKDIAFHFNARLAGSAQQRVVVCNTQTRGSWGPEVRLLEVPFQPGEHFDMVILSEQGCYKVSVNNRHIAQYTYRVKDLPNITDLEILGEMTLLHVRVQ